MWLHALSITFNAPLLLFFLLMFYTNPILSQTAENAQSDSTYFSILSYPKKTRLSDIIWQQREGKTSGSEQSIKGGIYRQLTGQLPPHIRRIGPGSDTQFAARLNQLHMPLIGFEATSQQYISMLARKWYFDYPSKRIFFQLDPTATWSDGEKISTRDISFTFDFLLNPDSKATTQRKRILSLIKNVEIYNDLNFSIVSQHTLTPEIIKRIISLRPLARHFYTPDKTWPDHFNNSFEPTTGPYSVSSFLPGEQIVFSRISDWWAASKQFFKHRFNINKIIYRQEASNTKAFDLFSSGEIDSLNLDDDKSWSAQEIITFSKEKKATRIMFFHQGKRLYQSIILNNLSLKFKNKDKRKYFQRLFSNSHSAASKNHEAGKYTLLYTNKSSLPQINHFVENARQHNIHIELAYTNSKEMLTRIRNNNYELAWLLIEKNENESASDWFEKVSGHPQSEQEIVLLDNGKVYSRYIVWDWINMPEYIANKHSADMLSTLDLMTGGLFWIDTAKKIDLLGNPAREDSLEGLIINDDYK